MSKVRHALDLKSKLSLCAIISLVATFAFFYLLGQIGYNVVDSAVYDTDFELRQTQKILESMQETIDTDGLYIKDADVLWQSNSKVYLMLLFQNNEVVYGSGGVWDTMNDNNYRLEDFDNPGVLNFVDGSVDAVIYADFTTQYYALTIIVCAFISLLFFGLFFMLLIRRRLHYIVKLEQEMRILEGGDLRHEVLIAGHDELGRLAESINDMRLSILKRQAGEERAMHAGRELVASMSHDLRTPLTSLIGYLELLNSKRYEDEAQRVHFSKNALDQAYRIKTMTDELFDYALGELQDEPDFSGENIDADLFIRQVLDEQRFNMEQEGFEIQASGENGAYICVEPEKMIRVFDNLFSNIRKYADHHQPIQIHWYSRGIQFFIEVTNTVAHENNKSFKSTGLGLNNCQNILLRHGGGFESRNDGELFHARIRLPISVPPKE